MNSCECRKVAAAFGFFAARNKLNDRSIGLIKADPERAILTAMAIDANMPKKARDVVIITDIYSGQQKLEERPLRPMPTPVQHAYYVVNFFKTVEKSNATKLPPSVVHLIGTIAAGSDDADFETTRLICEKNVKKC